MTKPTPGVPCLPEHLLADIYLEPVDDLERRDARRIAKWAADEQLARCTEWLRAQRLGGHKDSLASELASELHDAMRPKLPSLKRQALDATYGTMTHQGICIIRQALESLPDD